MTRRGSFVAAAAVILGLADPAPSQRIEDVPRVHALTGARIVTAPGRAIDHGTIVLRDGLIEAVGAGIEVPADARVWDLAGENLTIGPGLIDAYVARPWPDAVMEAEKKAQGLHPNPLVRPARQMALFAGDEAAAKRLREAGFSTAAVAPKGGLFRGQSAIVNLTDDTERQVLRASWAQHVTLAPGSSAGGYPSSLMGAVALFRQTVHDARWSSAARRAYELQPAQERPAINLALETLGAALASRRPLVVDAGDPQATLRIARLARELELPAVIVVGNGREYQRLEAIAATGLPHLLPVAFPDAPTIERGNEDNVDLAELRHWDQAPDNLAAVMATDLVVGLTTDGLDDPKRIHGHLARAIERGLDPDRALAALTTVPAELLGIQRLAGTLEPGKIANLIVVEGGLFTAETKVREVWVDGDRYEVRAALPPAVEPAGGWDLAITTGDGQDLTGRLDLAGSASALAGTLVVMGQELPLAAVDVSGTALRIELDGAPLGLPGTIEMTVEIEGERLRGSGTSPAGPFTVEGERVSRPAPEELR